MPKLTYTLYDIMIKIIDDGGISKKNINDGLDIVLNLFYPCAYLSSKSFLHYDIKENNIGFANNKPVLFDFGLSNKFTAGKKLIYEPSRRISQSMDLYMYQKTSACLLDKFSIDLDELSNKTFTSKGKVGKDNYDKMVKWIKNFEDTNYYIDVKSLAGVFGLNKDEYIKKTIDTLMVIYGYCLPTFNDNEKKWLAKKILFTIDSYALGITLLFYFNVIKEHISKELKNDLLEIIKYSCHYNILERFWPTQVVELTDKMIKKHHLSEKYKIRPYKIPKMLDIPHRIKEVMKIIK